MTAALSVEELSKSFGGVNALRELSFEVESGQIVGLIGPNGSGKSTTVNTLAGVFPASSGTILLGGTPIQDRPQHVRVALGLTRTFQTASVFPELTVRQQVALACEPTIKAHPLGSIFGFGGADRLEIEERVEDILALTGLSAVGDQEIGTISAAQQRFLMVATTLAAKPKVVLLDEPAAGMISQERDALCDMIVAISARGIAVLVIEHHMALIMRVCHRIVVLNFGAKIAEGTPDEIRNDRAVIDAYLGEAV
ncbi:MAG: ABC transporter ATP-binding protein [Rhodospirillales bacterium]